MNEYIFSNGEISLADALKGAAIAGGALLGLGALVGIGVALARKN